MLRINCENCGDEIVIGKGYKREHNFCTIRCLFEYNEKQKNIDKKEELESQLYNTHPEIEFSSILK